MKPIRSLALVLVVAGLAACAGSGNADPEVTAPLPTVAPTTDDGGPSETDSADAEHGSARPRRRSRATETTTAVEPGGFLPADLGTPVDGAPGVDTPGEVVELIDNGVDLRSDRAGPGRRQCRAPAPRGRQRSSPLTPRRKLALSRAGHQNPMPAEPSEAMRATSRRRGSTSSAENIFAVRSPPPAVPRVSGGWDVLRPVVIADPRSETEAFIFDCQSAERHSSTADGISG